MKKIIFTLGCLILMVMMTGCASQSSFRQTIGRPLSTAGQSVGKTGNEILVVSGISIVLIPVGVALWIPTVVISYPLYYGGNFISGDDLKCHPFEL